MGVGQLDLDYPCAQCFELFDGGLDDPGDDAIEPRAEELLGQTDPEPGERGVETTMASYLVGLAVSQLFYGPISDRFGRKPPLYFGFALYALGAAGCALAASMPALNAARDTAVITVTPRNGPQDEHTRALVDRLRREVIPAALRDTGATAVEGA